MADGGLAEWFGDIKLLAHAVDLVTRLPSLSTTSRCGTTDSGAPNTSLAGFKVRVKILNEDRSSSALKHTGSNLYSINTAGKEPL